MKKTSFAAGVCFVLLAAFSNGLLPLLVTNIYRCGGHFTNVVFYKALFVVPAALLLCLLTKQRIRISLRQHLACMVIAVFQTATSLLLFGSYVLIPTGLATTLHFMYPVAVMVITFLVFRERPTRGCLLGLACCVAGVILLCSNQGELKNALGIPVALLSGVVYAGYIIAVGKSAARTLPSLVFTLYIFLYDGLLAGGVSLIGGTLKGLTGNGWIIAAISAVASGIAAFTYQRGIVAIGSQRASILSIAEPLVSVLIGVAFLHESFPFSSVLGTICIVLASIFTVLSKNSDKASSTPGETGSSI